MTLCPGIGVRHELALCDSGHSILDPRLDHNGDVLTVSPALMDRYLSAAERGLIMGKRGLPKKASTIYVDRGRIARHIKPVLGSKRVRDLAAADINRFIREVADGKTATVEKTANKRGKAVVGLAGH